MESVGGLLKIESSLRRRWIRGLFSTVALLTALTGHPVTTVETTKPDSNLSATICLHGRRLRPRNWATHLTLVAFYRGEAFGAEGWCRSAIRIQPRVMRAVAAKPCISQRNAREETVLTPYGPCVL